MNAPLRLSGAKAGEAVNTPDNLFSTDTVELILGIGEGPIRGLVGGDKNFYLGDTPLRNSGGDSNFENYTLKIYKGSVLGQEIKPFMGGFGDSTSVGVELGAGTPVVRSGSHTQIDYIDLRFVINRLVKSDKKGSHENTGVWKIEYKRSDSGTWRSPKTFAEIDKTPVEDDATATFYADDMSDETQVENFGDLYVFIHNTNVPSPSLSGKGVWLKPGANYQPWIWNGTSWIVAPEATQLPTLADGTLRWTFKKARKDGVRHLHRLNVGPTKPTVQAVTYETRQSDLEFSFWVNTSLDTAANRFFYNGTAWIKAGTSIEVGGFGEPVVTTNAGEIKVKAKISSPYVKELRIPVPRINATYDLRVTKVTEDDPDGEEFFDLTWESFQEINKDPLNFPGLACAHLLIGASDQFTSLPDPNGIYDGRIIKVPSNYDPVARTYAGVWDGTWKLAYSNNPAYVVKDLVDNDRYGLNAYYECVINPDDVYAAGRWCDTITPDGRPRFTFNGLISEPRMAREAIDFICGIFGGRFFDDGNGFATIKLDADTPTMGLFTAENVVDGLFTYSSTEVNTRYNDIQVTFINPDLDWEEDRRRVYDQSLIDKYGRIPLPFIAVGCTNVREAIARARYKLITSTAETRLVSFKTNRQGLYVQPFDIILVADDQISSAITGRVHSRVSDTEISLRDPIFLESGFQYRILFQVPNPVTNVYQVIEIPLLPKNLGSSRTTLEVASNTPFPDDLPEYAVFTIQQTNGNNAPRPYRISSIGEGADDPDNVEITAVEVNRLKWLYVDGILDDYDDVITNDLNSKRIKPVPDIRVRSVFSRNTRNVIIDWDPSPSKLVQKYQVFYSIDKGPTTLLTETNQLAFDWANPPLGDYVFSVVAVGINGKRSRPTSIDYRMVGDVRQGAGITGLRLVDEPSANIFERRSPTFRWDDIADPDHDQYQVVIKSAAGAVVHTELQKQSRFTYEYDVNKAENGGDARRNFTIEVASVDKAGDLSDAQSLSVSNPAPAAPTGLSVQRVDGAIVIKYDVPPIRDFMGVKVHQSPTNGFTPLDDNVVYKGPNTQVTLPAVSNATTYYKVALYDQMDEANLNYGAQLSITVPRLPTEDTTPPAAPTNFKLTSGVNHVLLEWTDPSDGDLQWIEIFRNTSNNLNTAKMILSAVASQQSVVVTGLQPSVTYYFWARAVDKSSNRSGFIGPVSGQITVIPTDYFADGSVIATKVATAAIDASKLMDGAVTDLKIAAGAVSAAKLATGAVLSDKIADGAINTAKFATGIAPVELVNSLPTTGNFQGRTVFLKTDNKQYRYTGSAWTAAVPASDISGQVTAAQVAGVNASQITGTITSTQIANESISTPKIAVGAIDAGRIAAGSIQTSKIAAGAVTADTLASNSVTSDKITGNAITAGKIAAGAVSTLELAAGAINANKIAAGAISADKMAANSVTANAIVADAITAVKIQAGAVVSEKIAAGAITSEKIVAGSITAREMTIVNYDNMIPDPDIQTPGAWTLQPGWTLNPTSPVFKSTGRLEFDYSGGTGDSPFFRSQPWSVVAGDSIYASVQCRRIGGTQVSPRIRVRWEDANGVAFDSTWLVNSAQTSSLIMDFSRTYEVPAGAMRARLEGYLNLDESDGDLYVGTPYFRKRFGAELIVEGAITAQKIAANAVTANAIAANSISAGHISAGAVTAAKISVNNLAAISANLGTIKVASANIDDLVVQGRHIQDFAVTNDSYVVWNTVTLGSGSNNADLPGSSLININGASLTVVIPAGGARVEASATIDTRNISGGEKAYTLEIYANAQAVPGARSSSNYYQSSISTSGLTSLNEGTYTFRLRGAMDLNMDVVRGTMIVRLRKK